MDPALLRAELIQKGVPQLVAGWENTEFFKLLTMYEQKCSLLTLAVHFGKTRGQIAGLLHRAAQKGLVNRLFLRHMPLPEKVLAAQRKITLADHHTQKLATRIRAVKPKKRRVRLRLIDDSNQVTFGQLEPHHCRWPIGDPRQPDFRFCGCRRMLKRPYCEAHNLKAGRLYDQQKADAR